MPHTLEREQLQDLTQALFQGGSAPPVLASKPGARSRWLYVAGILVLLAIAATIALVRRAPAATYGKAEVRRATLAKTVSATGRLQALTTVQVGTQVSGTISEMYVDFNSQVKKDQVIARLDPAQLQAQLTQTTANLTGAQASVQTHSRECSAGKHRWKPPKPTCSGCNR